MVSSSISVFLVAIAGLSNTSLELHPSSLLDDVGSFVCGCVKTWRFGEADAATSGKGTSPHRHTRCCSGPADVGVDLTDVMSAEGGLNPIGVGQRRRSSLRALGSGSSCLAGVGRCPAAETHLDLSAGGVFDPGTIGSLLLSIALIGSG